MSVMTGTNHVSVDFARAHELIDGFTFLSESNRLEKSMFLKDYHGTHLFCYTFQYDEEKDCCNWSRNFIPNGIRDFSEYFDRKKDRTFYRSVQSQMSSQNYAWITPGWQNIFEYSHSSSFIMLCNLRGNLAQAPVQNNTVLLTKLHDRPLVVLGRLKSL